MGEIKPKFIDTGSGAEIVILTRAEYDELVARAEDDDEEAEAFAVIGQLQERLANDNGIENRHEQTGDYSAKLSNLGESFIRIFSSTIEVYQPLSAHMFIHENI